MKQDRIKCFSWHKFLLLVAPIVLLCLCSIPLLAAPTQDVEADPVLVGAGDVATCNAGADEQTAQLIDGIGGTVFVAGDGGYDDGTLAEFNNCYQPTWGRHKARTKPVPGNHEYHTAGAVGYYSYFGDAASPQQAGCTINCKGYYSYNLGAWHIVMLNSEIGASATSAQAQWLSADLAAHPTTCTVAILHRPPFSSGEHGNWAGGKDLFRILYANQVDLVLAGHDHHYERFAQQDPDGNRDDARGFRSIVVGTGGKSLRPFFTLRPNSLVRNDSAFGVLKLTLHASSYDWQFVSVAGQSFTDSGSDTCVGAGGSTPTPTPIGPTPTPKPTKTPTPIGTPAGFDTLYLSSTSAGTVGGVNFADEDVLAHDLNSGAWRKVFDGSRFGLDAADVDAFDFLANGSLLLAFDVDVTLPGGLLVKVNDIAKFTPSQAGNYAAGSFSLFLDGSDVGLELPTENIDAIAIASDGRLVISTDGDLSATGLLANDEDLVVLTGQTGANSSGTWSQYFDGSDLGMNNSTEDVRGVWSAPNKDLYVNTLGAFFLQGLLEGDQNDIFTCVHSALGTGTRCAALRIFWDGNDHGFGSEQLDDFALADSRQLAAAALENDLADPEVDDSVSSDIDEDQTDGDESGSDEEGGAIYLPFVSNQ